MSQMNLTAFGNRKPLKDIVKVPERVQSVYSLPQHVWAEESDAERNESKNRNRVRLETLDKFFINPVRAYLNRIFEKVADGEGQGLWMLSNAFRALVTSRIEVPGLVGLVLVDSGPFCAYDLGGNDISLARQVTINGKRVCRLVAGTMRDSRLWIFDDDAESRRAFPEALVFKNSGWMFELAE